MFELKGTITRIKGRLFRGDPVNVRETNAILKEMENSGSPENAFYNLKSVFLFLCRKAEEAKRSHNTRLRDDVIEFLNTNYMRPELNLYLVASQFDLTENYFSQFFKDQTGKAFTGYLEELRMRHAVTLFARSRRNIKDIAGQVGYANVNTFYKAFRRMYGMNPRAYRENAVRGL